MDIPVETWYQWKEYGTLDEEDGPRLFTPRADPMEYEFPIDFIFDSVEQAVNFLTEWDIEREESKDWVLVKVTYEPVLLIRDNYIDRECPDCGETISVDMVSGGECCNCGHIFYEEV
jgi:hypothetical protein